MGCLVLGYLSLDDDKGGIVYITTVPSLGKMLASW